MGSKRKPVSILKRSVRKGQNDVSRKDHEQHTKRQKIVGKPKKDLFQPGCWQAASLVDRQAASAISKLLQADATGTRGASIKSLTLAPAVQAKKATHAVTCETLRMLPIVRQLISKAGLLEQHSRLSPSTAYVLCYELLFGEGLRSRGPAEAALTAAETTLQDKLASMLQEAGVEDARDLIAAAPKGAHNRPRTARVNTLKMTVKEALAWLKSPPFEGSRWAQKVTWKQAPKCFCSVRDFGFSCPSWHLLVELILSDEQLWYQRRRWLLMPSCQMCWFSLRGQICTITHLCRTPASSCRSVYDDRHLFKSGFWVSYCSSEAYMYVCFDTLHFW